MRRLFLSWRVPLVLLACCAPALAQPPPALDVAPLRLFFAGDDRAERLAGQRVDIRNAGGGQLVWEAHADAPWVLLAPPRGLAPAALLVSIDARSLRPGTHEARVVVDALHSERSPQTIVVRVALASTQPAGPPALQVTPSRVTLSAAPGQAPVVSSALHVSADQDSAVEWTARTDTAWLAVAPATGTTPARITVTATPGSLSIGEHTANVLIYPAGRGDVLRVPVAIEVQATSGPLAFDAIVLAAAVLNEPYSQALPIRGGRAPFRFQLSGSLPPDLSLLNGVVTGVPKMPGTFEFGVIATDSAEPPAAVTQTLTLRVAPAGQRVVLAVDPDRVSLAATTRGTPNSVAIQVSSGGAALSWRVSADASWVQIDRSGGRSAGSFTVTARTAALRAGTYRAWMTVTMEGAENSPVRIPVDLVIRD